MVGYGVTLPVLPFYIERLALNKGATLTEATFHVGILTGIFPFMQFFFAPLWGKLADRLGRRPIFLIGLPGYIFSMFFFAVGTNLLMLYAARIFGGILSAAVLPVAAAVVADITSEKDRGKAMAWLGSATGLGVVVGPSIGAFLSQTDFHFISRFWHFKIDSFSIPFFAAAILGILTLVAAIYWFPETLKSPVRQSAAQSLHLKDLPKSELVGKSIPQWLVAIMILGFLNYFALSVFEGTFALHAKMEGGFGPTEMGWVFTMCGFVMAAGQGIFVAKIIGRFKEKSLLIPGFSLMIAGLVLLMTTRNIIPILLYVAVFSFGIALITPSVATLVSKRAGQNLGIALGRLSAANSLGQASGPSVGGFLFAWHIHAPYLVTTLLLGVAVIFLVFTLSTQSNRFRYFDLPDAKTDETC